MKTTFGRFALLFCASFFLTLRPSAFADGNDMLGPPSIPIATGTDVIEAGTGLIVQPGMISISIPAGVTIKQVLLYWEGRSGDFGDPFLNAPGPTDTIFVNAVPVTGNRIGGPIPFGTFPASTAYRQDITALVQAGTIPMTAGAVNVYSLSGLNFGFANDGAGLLVIVDDGTGANSIQIYDGDDVVITQPGPQVGVLLAVPVNFTFPATAFSRQADLINIVGDAQEFGLRGNALKITIGNAAPIILVDPFQSFDGARWDTLRTPLVIPAGVTNVTVQPLSEDLNNPPLGTIPSSLVWVGSVLRLQRGAPPLLFCSPDRDLGCNPTNVPTCDLGSVTVQANSNCLPVTVTCSSTDITNGCNRTRLLTYTATDACSNQASCTQQITWKVDTTPPVITFNPPLGTFQTNFQCMSDYLASTPITFSASDNCDGTNVSVSAISGISGPGCPTQISACYTAVDQCSNVTTICVLITIRDTIPPVITCPPGFVIGCDSNIPPCPASLAAFRAIGGSASDNCDTNLQYFCSNGAIVGNQMVRTHTVVDSCTNSASCTQVITFSAGAPPTIFCPPDIAVQCTNNIPLAFTNISQFLAGGGFVSSTNLLSFNVASTPLVGGQCGGIITRTYSISDGCSNVVSCQQRIVVRDTTPPTLTCAADQQVQCGTAWSFTAPTASDNCDLQNVLVEIVSTVTNATAPSCPTLMSVTRTWKATDSCTNVSFCGQTVTVVDTQPPVLVCAQDKEVQCGVDWSFDIPTATDNCDLNNVVIQIVSTVTNTAVGGCPRFFSVTRTWRATDTCTNSAVCSQTVSIVDLQPPVITCGADKEVQCGSDWVFDIPTAVDSCAFNNVLIEVVSTVTNVALPRCPKIASMTRTWKATDTCGNAAFCNQTVTVVDTEAPHLTCAADRIVECNQPFFFTPPTAIDSCDFTNVVIAIVSTTTNVAIPRCPNLFTVRRTWSATDTCGNQSLCSQTITVADTTPPNITCADDQIVECNQPFAFTPPYAIDECDGTNIVIAIVSTTTNAALPRCPNLFTVRRTWSATDTCGNQSLCAQTITVADTTPPNITCAGDQIVECGHPFAFTRPFAIDGCDGTNVTINIVSTVTNAAAGGCPSLFTVRRTWSAADSCGNESLCSQTLTVVDTTPPNITCADDLIVECDGKWNFIAPTAVDVCSGTNVTITIVSTVTNLLTDACPKLYTANRTWRVADSCGNETFCTQKVTEVDTTPPNITCSDDLIVECGNAWNFIPPTAVDVCNGTNVTISIVSTVTNVLTGQCPSLSTATRTWRAVDPCGNESFCSQRVTVVDTTPPNISCSHDLIVECGNAWSFLAPTAVDICSGADVTISVVSTVTNLLAGECPQLYRAVRTWRAVDTCGNESFCSQRVTVVDTTPPNITCADDRVVQCGVPWNFTPPFGVDICDGANVTTAIVSTVTNGLCGSTFSAIRTWRVSDSCSNSVTCSQAILIVDTRPPDMTCAPDRIVECGTPWTFSAPYAVDICSGTNVTVSVVGTVTNALCGSTFSATRTWSATDACGNRATCTQTITLVDTLAPTLSCAGNRTVECGTPFSFTPPTATDFCDGGSPAIVIVSTETNGLCGRTFSATRTWRATDACGNTAVCSQTIMVIDSQPPTLIGVPNNQTFLCLGDVPPLANVAAFDDCDLAPTLIFQSSTNGNCPTIITRCWTAIDHCSNSVTECQYIFVRPNAPVVQTGPTNQTVCLGETATFCSLVSSSCTLTYQWAKNGVNIPGATGSCLTITNVTLADVAEYCVKLVGPCNALTNCARLSVLTNVAVVIPTPDCVARGSLVSLCPIISGNGPFTCVWKKQIAPGVFGPVAYQVVNCCLQIPNFSPSDAGVYQVEVTGACNNASSTSTNHVTLCPPMDLPAFPITVVNGAGTPTTPNACAGTSLTLCTPDYGSFDITYQWFKGASAIAGATARCYTIANPTPADVGTYCVRITGCTPNCKVTNCVTIEGCAPCLVLTKTAVKATVAPGGTASYVYAVTNCGGLTLTNVVVVDDNATPGFTSDDFIVATNVTLLAGEGKTYTASRVVPTLLCDSLGLKGTLITEDLGTRLRVTFFQDTHLNNNTYGTNIINWTKAHKFQDLVGSDKAEFTFKNSAGTVVLQFAQDYITAVTASAQFPAGYRSLGATGGDGGITVGSAASILAYTTSLEQNLNKAPFVTQLAKYTANSPALNDPNFPLWEVQMIYSVEIAKSAFGASGFGSVAITSQHNSPESAAPRPPCELCMTNIAKATARTTSAAFTNILTSMDDAKVCIGTNATSPCIDVTKMIACLLPGDNCGPFGKLATGFKGLQDPGFCYSITISNCGDVALTNLSVVDNKLGNLTTLFVAGSGTSLPVGASITKFVKTSLSVDTTNTVTVTGKAVAPGGATVTDTDKAVGLVDIASITCQTLVKSTCDLDGNPNDNHVRLPTNNVPCPVTIAVTVCNNGDADLVNVKIVGAGFTTFGCVNPAPFNLPAGSCVTINCSNMISCSEAPLVSQMTFTAQVKTDATHCGYDRTGTNLISVTTSCPASVECGGLPCFNLIKTVNKTNAQPGETVIYSYVATNCGGTVLTGLTITDDNGTPGFPGDDVTIGNVASLAPGASMAFTRSLQLPVTICADTSGAHTGLLITEVLPNGDIQVTFIQGTNVNDNTYGVNAIGWGSKGHKFSDLTGSDQATFRFKNAAGQVVLEFKEDYISAASTALYPAGYGTLGVLGGDGDMIVGDAADVLDVSSSLTENLNKQPFLSHLAQYTVNSPAPSDPNSALWEYRDIYTVVVSKDAFGASGFGSVAIIDQHNSPAKMDKFEPIPCSGCVTNIATAVIHSGATTITDTAQAVVCTGDGGGNHGGKCPNKADFWERNTSIWPSGYLPTQTVGSKFNKAPADAAGKTLLQALQGKAGSSPSIKELLKEAVAALLNAASPDIDYPFTTSDVVESVNMAFMNGHDNACKSLTTLLKQANEKKDKCKDSGPPKPPGHDDGNCDTDGRPNVLTLRYTGQSCAEAVNSQVALGKASCTGDPHDAPTVRVVVTDSSTAPTASTTRYFDAMVALNGQFEVKSTTLAKSTFGANTYMYIYSGSTLVQSLSIHTSCSAPLRRGETFGALALVDYRIDP